MYETQDDHEPRALAVVTPRVNLDKQQLMVLKQTIAPDLTGPELAFFGNVCQRMQLDPFARQIYAIKRGDKLTIQIGIDGFRALAERTGLYRGQIGPFWCGPDGEWKDVWLSDEPPVACKIGILREGFKEPIWTVARTNAYRQEKNPLWRTMSEVLIARSTEALGIRRTFPGVLSGAYEHAEMDQAGYVDMAGQVEVMDEAEYAAARVAESAPEPQPVSAQTRPAPAAQPARKPAPPTATATVEGVTGAQWDALKARMRDELGLTNVAAAKAFMRAHLKHDLEGAIPSLAEYDTLIAGVNRASQQKRDAEAKLGRTARPAPSADELAAAQADYDASQADQDFPPADNDIDLSKLEIPAVRP